MEREDGTSNKPKNVVLSFTGKHVGLTTVFLASFACVSCVAISLWKDFESSTGTHCGRKVPNYMPTISSAIGGYTPQRYIWRFCMGFNSAPRLMVAVMIQGYYKAICSPAIKRRRLYGMLANLSSALHAVENLGLVGLSFVSSTENTFIHEACFAVFMVASEVHMLVTTILYKWSCHGRRMEPQERTSYRRKVALFLLNVGFFLISIYLYFRHNNYCEPGVYSLFAIMEYCCIATNIAYHYTTMVLDMGHVQHKAILPFPPHIHHSETNGVNGGPQNTNLVGNGHGRRHLVNGWNDKNE